MWWIAAALVSAPAEGPTYLICSIDRAPSPITVEASIDEANMQATIRLPATGHVARAGAVFSPTEVRVPDGPAVWVVDRVGLAFQRVITIGDRQSIERGACKITPTPARRAF